MSKQVQWEVQKIYKITPEVLRAGFSRKELSSRNQSEGWNRKSNETIRFLMVNRLVKKKRVDLVINAFKKLKIDYQLIYNHNQLVKLFATKVNSKEFTGSEYTEV